MRGVLRWAAVVVVGLVLGLGSAALVLTGEIGGAGGTRVGAWSIDLSRGSSDAGVYVRSATAVQALLAMTKQEAVYFIADVDDEDRPLDTACTYELRGGSFPATWWSITLYDGAYLAENDDAHPSLDATGVDRGTGPEWTARLATTPGDGINWISMRGADRPNLLLRLYVPEQSVLDDPSSVDVPAIRRVSCEGAR